MRSPLMHPGRACITCHTTGTGFLNLQHGPSFTLAGTVYPSAHEPDDCNGAAGGGVSVVITGAAGQSLTLTPNAVGNFTSLARVVLPYMVEIRAAGRVRAAATPHQNGDCNSCHSQQGQQGAPGRLLMP
jgi:mono/diheme cytochrome c family protein